MDRNDKPAISRRTAVGGLAAGGLLAACSTARTQEVTAATRIRLKKAASERALPPRMLGMNTNLVYDIPYEDPAAIAAIKAVGPNIVRFPGGTVGNYYQWRTGFMSVPDGPGASTYRRYMIDDAVPRSKRIHPQGVFIEDWTKVVRELDADLVFNPNLETSTVPDQAAWFAHMHRLGIVPKNIEMGAEFYLAMFMDPIALAVTPNWAVTIARTREYYEAFKPYLASDAKIAVQSASSSFHHRDPLNSGDPLYVHEGEWDRDMKPEPWFDAVVTHLYPGMTRSAGPDALKNLTTDTERIYMAMLGRADEGYDRSLSDTIARMPGKEVWMTEWGAFEPAQTLGGQTTYFSGLWLHQVTRGQLAMLRHPQVTMANFHSATFAGNLMASFTRINGVYTAINATSVLHWFFSASRGPDSHYQQLTVEGGQRLRADGAIPGEHFNEIEAAIFRQGRRRTLIVQNAWKTPHQLDLRDVAPPQAKVTADTIATPDLLANFEKGAPQPVPLASDPVIVIPPYSVSRIVWTV